MTCPIQQPCCTLLYLFHLLLVCLVKWSPDSVTILTVQPHHGLENKWQSDTVKYWRMNGTPQPASGKPSIWQMQPVIESLFKSLLWGTQSNAGWKTRYIISKPNPSSTLWVQCSRAFNRFDMHDFFDVKPCWCLLSNSFTSRWSINLFIILSKILQTWLSLLVCNCLALF